jgi:DNA-binding XRE family transcriptional regulator
LAPAIARTTQDKTLAPALGSGIGYAAMFLMYSRPHSRSYQTSQPLTRVDSLPYLFRKFRIHHNLTKRALAAKFCISEKYVEEIERGSKLPSLRISTMYAKEFGANPEWVKRKWFKDTVEHFSERLRRKIALEN